MLIKNASILHGAIWKNNIQPDNVGLTSFLTATTKKTMENLVRRVEVDGESVALAYSEEKKLLDLELLDINKRISNDMKEVYKETQIALRC